VRRIRANTVSRDTVGIELFSVFNPRSFLHESYGLQEMLFFVVEAPSQYCWTQLVIHSDLYSHGRSDQNKS
jgi:hypothetical protein